MADICGVLDLQLKPSAFGISGKSADTLVARSKGQSVGTDGELSLVFSSFHSVAFVVYSGDGLNDCSIKVTHQPRLGCQKARGRKP